MKVILIKETEETCDIVKRILVKIKKFLNIIKSKFEKDNNIYCLPIFKDSKISTYRIKKISNKINKLLEKDGSNTIVLSGYLDKNQLLKNYLYAENINILDGRFLFKCLSEKILEYIYKIKGKEIELRRSFYFN